MAKNQTKKKETVGANRHGGSFLQRLGPLAVEVRHDLLGLVAEVEIPQVLHLQRGLEAPPGHAVEPLVHHARRERGTLFRRRILVGGANIPVSEPAHSAETYKKQKTHVRLEGSLRGLRLGVGEEVDDEHGQHQRVVHHEGDQDVQLVGVDLRFQRPRVDPKSPQRWENGLMPERTPSLLIRISW